jgi:tetratricopeptide (TPR) repeat protein
MAWSVVWIVILISVPYGYVLDPIYSRLPNNPTLLILVTFVLGLSALMAWVVIPPFLIGWDAHRALQRGDYALALRRVEWIKRFSIDRTLYDGTRSSVLISAGRPQEAEEIVSKGLKTERVKKAAGLHLDNLGLALMDQGRYEEAEAMFRRSLQAYPDRGGAYDGLAELLILRGEPGPSLEAAEQALTREQSRGWLYRRLSPGTCGRMWANRAWALAALGRRRDAEQAILNAFTEIGTKDNPELAGVHYGAGMMRASLGDMRQAQEEWSAAKRLDPDGRYGRKADQALAPPTPASRSEGLPARHLVPTDLK